MKLWNARSIWLFMILMATSSAPAVAQRLGQGSDDSVSWWRVVAALILCLLLAGAAAVVIKIRLHGHLPSPKAFLLRAANQGRRLQLIEALKVSEHIDVCIIACDGKELLVAASPQRADILERLPHRDGADEGSSA